MRFSLNLALPHHMSQPSAVAKPFPSCVASGKGGAQCIVASPKMYALALPGQGFVCRVLQDMWGLAIHRCGLPSMPVPLQLVGPRTLLTHATHK